MTNKKLAILAVVAVVLVIFTWVLSSMTGRSVKKGKLNAPLLQGLNTRDIAGITLSEGKETTKLQSKGNEFVLTNKDNYPVLISKVNNLIASCLDIKTAELVTENPANHADLEVTEDTTDQTKPHTKNIVKFLDANGKLITGLVVGKRDYETGGAYVRLISDEPKVSNRVYLTLNAPWLQMSPMSYIEKKLFMVKKEDIASVTVTGPKGSYNITSDEAGKITLKDIPEGKKAKGTVKSLVYIFIF